MVGFDEGGDLPNVSTLCGRCEAVCPMSIPLPGLLRRLRERQHEQRKGSRLARLALAGWGYLAQRPRLYRRVMALGVAVLARLGRRRGRLRRLPLARGWTQVRDLPAPEGETFQAAWNRRRGGRP